MNQITTLASNEVFCFGSNAAGFHGAGAAGHAMRGTSANTWRTDEAFLRAMKAPEGHHDRIGKWAVYGVGRGWQQGREGMSYAIQTIERPGLKRSTPLKDIEDQLIELWGFAEQHKGWSFLMTPIGSGLSGWTAAEMNETLGRAIHGWGYVPDNVVIPENLYGGGLHWTQPRSTGTQLTHARIQGPTFRRHPTQ